MFAESWQAGFLNWILTYLLHSTILLGGVWLMTSLISSRHDALKETCWKFALIGGLVTATMQAGFHVKPITGQVNLFDTTLSAPAPEDVNRTEGEDRLSEVNENGFRQSNDRSDPPATSSASQGLSLESLVLRVQHTLRHELGLARSKFAQGIASGLPAMPWLIAGILTLAIASIVLALYRLRSELSGRRLIVSGRVCELFDDLCDRAGVSREILLSRSNRIASPVAMGLLKPEICLPERALEELSDPELEVMIAHELAHIVRRDPLWALICHVMSTLLIIQPLNIIAARRLRELAEFECDGWAAAHCDGALPLAKCLTEVASWLLQTRRMTTFRLVSGMSVHQSTLRKRVGRLLEEDWRLPSGATNNMVLMALTFVLGSVIILTPAVSAVSMQRPGMMTPEGDIPEPKRLDALVSSPVAEPTLVTESRFSEVSDPFAALDAELDLLEAEVEGLRATLRGTPVEVEIFNLIDQFEQKITSIRDRKARLEIALNERYPNNPDPVRRPRSIIPEPTHARRSP